ncbi:hypothetical protein MKCMC460_60080 (plasmid) [Mycobacterium sp. 20KCMC460]|nr:hypothetical protein MKCMC460_60080 [Mycobacterium sp. 20KCMC460]
MQPCAPDVVSVGASTRFDAQVVLARWYTTVANRMARQFGVLLDAGADAYDGQEAASSAVLGGAALPSAAAGVSLPTAALEAADWFEGGQPSSLPSVPGGQVPASPRDIARLIDSGRAGPGPPAWQAVADSLRKEAGRLERAAEQLAGVIAAAQHGWNSTAADAALARMRSLRSWFEGHATYVRGLAAAATGHVEDFRTAAAQIPEFSAIVAAERELRAANDANVRSRGTLQPAVVRAQVQLSKLYTQSADGFKNYTSAAGATSPHPPPAPPAWTPGSHPEPVPTAGPGDAVISHKTDAAPANAPLEPVDAGNGVGEDVVSAGPTWPPTGVDPDAVDVRLADALPDAAAVAPQVIPAVVGGVVGGAGGALGGLMGAGGQAMQGLQPASMMSGLGEQSGGGGPQQGGEEPPQEAPPSPGGGDEAAPGGGGGGEPGDTEPAWGQGSLSAPPGLSAAPAAAAPMSAPMASSALPEAAPAAGAPMGAMVPPMMGGPRGSGSGDDKNELYKDRELKVVAPPNSEPVKGRREGRGSRDGAAK